MGMLNIHGPTITATEGEESRLYRKITVPTFNEETHKSVWMESNRQTKAMLRSWEETGLVSSLNTDVATLTLHVISKVCFGRSIQWTDDNSAQEKPPSGHAMSYRKAMSSLLGRNSTIFMTPKPILSK